jgi:membrane fusion protein (multidrug efflux system)
MLNVKRLWPVAAVAVVLLLIFEWRPWHSFSNSDQASAKTQRTFKEEPALEASKQDIRAQLSAVTYNSIASELNARISGLPFKEGQAFKVGQVLVVFDCATQQAQFQKTKAVLSIADRNYQTNKKLLALDSVGRVEYENSYSEFLKAKAENDELAAVLARCNVLAPYSGLVVEQKVRPQQFVQAGQPLIDILDKGALELEFVAPSKWSAWLVEGYKFEIKIDETGKSYPAKITRINGKIDPVSQTIKVAAVIDGDFKEISPGMSGVLVINPPDASSK